TRLRVTDPDHGPDQVTFTLDVPPASGTLSLDAVPLGAGDTFTQDDIDQSLITYTHDGSETTADSFSFTAADPPGDDVSATFNITVTPQNDTPTVATNDPLVVDEGDSRTIRRTLLLIADVDDLPVDLTYTLDTLPANGTLVLDGVPLALGGHFTQQDVDDVLLVYAHDASETTADGFDFTVEDPDSASVSDSFVIQIVALNDLPVVAVNAGVTVEEADSVDITATELAATDADDPATALTWTVDQAPAHGTLARSGTPLLDGHTFTQDDIDQGRITYTHDGSETTSDDFLFTLSDIAGPAVSDTFSIAVTPLNDPPVLDVNAGATLPEDTSVVIGTLLLSASDNDNTPNELVYTVQTAPTAGELRVNGVLVSDGGTFTQTQVNLHNLIYHHDGSEVHTDAFLFTIADGAGGSVPGTWFSIDITAVNDTPTLVVNEPLQVDEGATAPITPAELMLTDPDTAASALVFTLETVPATGVLSLDGTALALNDTFTQDDIDQGLVAYAHGGAEVTTDGFQFLVSDGAGGTNGSTLFEIDVAPVNDAPVLVANEGILLLESTTELITAAALAVSDVDNTAAELQYTVVSAPAHGELTLDFLVLGAGGTFTQDDIDSDLLTYTHDGSETVVDSFVFSVSDGAGGTISDTTFDISIDAENDPPVVDVNEVLQVEEGGVGTIDDQVLRVIDADNTPDELEYSIEVAPEHGIVLLDGTPLAPAQTFSQEDIDGDRVTYAHSGDEATADSFEFSVDDGVGGAVVPTLFSIDIGSENDPPVVAVNVPLDVAEGGSDLLTEDDLLITDSDNLPYELVITVERIPVQGVLTLYDAPLSVGEVFTQEDIDSQLVGYTHDGGESAADSFDFTVADGMGGTIDLTTFNFAIGAVNDRPVAVDDGPYYVEEDGVLVIEAADGILANDIDIEGDGLQAVLSLGVANGRLEIGPAGGFVLTPYEGFAGNDRFTYMAYDGKAPSNIASVIITVVAKPDEIDDTGIEDPNGSCKYCNHTGPAPASIWALLLGGLALLRRRKVRA
ncbi:MAG: tandem-95 repeat protein, partial [Deltaproteobacteria bacterium]|nr:tandem-95 repeat protein [Deltaproteobacteria bacterium]